MMGLTNVRDDLCRVAWLVCVSACLVAGGLGVSYACEGAWLLAVACGTVYAVALALGAVCARYDRAVDFRLVVILPLVMGLFFGPVCAWDAWRDDNWIGVAIGAVWFLSVFLACAVQRLLDDGQFSARLLWAWRAWR
jgi:hypothetical protein